MSDSPITVQVEGPVRLFSALLATTTWPYQEQDRKPHDIHAHAKATRTQLHEVDDHPAAKIMQDLLEGGHGLDKIYTYTNALNWPNLRARKGQNPDWIPVGWSAQLRDFLNSTKLRELWRKDEVAWKLTQEQAATALSAGDPHKFFTRFFGNVDHDLIFMPNLAFPTDQTVGFRRGKSLICVCPPRIAWGHNPPWPFDDDPTATYAEAIRTYARVLLRELFDADPILQKTAEESGNLPLPNAFRAKHPDWFDQFAVLFTNGLTALFLKETFGEAETKAFTMMVQKANGFKVMPSVVDVLDRYLQGQAEDKFQTFTDYMPIFSNALSVAEKLRSI